MSLTKTTTVDQITVTENGIVLYREATRIIEDGKQLSQTHPRTVSCVRFSYGIVGVPSAHEQVL